MKKALQDEVRKFYLSEVDGSISSWGPESNQFLESANRAHRFIGATKKANLRGWDIFCLELYRWLGRLVRYGESAGLIRDLNKQLNDVRYKHIIKKDSSGNAVWWQAVDFGAMDDPRSGAAYTFSHMLCAGTLKGLKRCKDCENFFLGRPNAKWCSVTCGSRHRVRAKRRRDRQSHLL
jgi:hypothetical protein